MHEETDIERMLKKKAYEISNEISSGNSSGSDNGGNSSGSDNGDNGNGNNNGPEVIIIVAGGYNSDLFRTMTGTNMHNKRLRDLLGMLETAKTIESIKHFQPRK